MKTLHIITTGSRPAKVDNRYTDFPTENANYIASVLDKGTLASPDTQFHIYHGAAAGVDTAVDDWAHAKLLTGMDLRIHQFPAIWQVWDNDQRKFVTNRFAGPQRNHAMIESANSAAYNKDDHSVILLAFHSTPTLQESKGTNDAVEKAKRKNIPVRVFPLPIQNAVPTTPFD